MFVVKNKKVLSRILAKKITMGAEFLRKVIFKVKQQAKYQKVGNFLKL